MERLREGFLYVKNPFNSRQVCRIDLSPRMMDCIVFWTKNPGLFMRYLEELSPYLYYFQFTLTGYGRDIEPGLPDKRERLIPIFQELSERIGKKRVVWRYDPIFVGGNYSADWHIKTFSELSKDLNGYTERATVMPTGARTR